jgi:hypothetical protein
MAIVVLDENLKTPLISVLGVVGAEAVAPR